VIVGLGAFPKDELRLTSGALNLCSGKVTIRLPPSSTTSNSHPHFELGLSAKCH
jgi:hypothetical protein